MRPKSRVPFSLNLTEKNIYREWWVTSWTPCILKKTKSILNIIEKKYLLLVYNFLF